MNLADNKIKEFLNLYDKEFGILLSLDEAELKAKKLIELVSFLHEDLSINN